MTQITLDCSQWVGHICCAQGVAKVLESETFEPGSDESLILGWALYYDVLARFSIRHWRTPAVRHVAKELGFDPKGSNFCALQYLLARDSFAMRLPNLALHGHPMLGLFSEVCETAILSADVRYHDEEYRASLTNLASRIEHLEFCSHTLALPATLVPLQLFRLATLIYLERVSKNFSGWSSQISEWTAEGFRLLSNKQGTKSPFPVFILACEARTDEHRLTILRVLDENFRLNQAYHNHLQTVKTIIQRAWVQDDLLEDGDLEYIRKLNLVISSSNGVPFFI